MLMKYRFINKYHTAIKKKKKYLQTLAFITFWRTGKNMKYVHLQIHDYDFRHNLH